MDWVGLDWVKLGFSYIEGRGSIGVIIVDIELRVELYSKYKVNVIIVDVIVDVMVDVMVDVVVNIEFPYLYLFDKSY